jgi:hypothetical protein
LRHLTKDKRIRIDASVDATSTTEIDESSPTRLLLVESDDSVSSYSDNDLSESSAIYNSKSKFILDEVKLPVPHKMKDRSNRTHTVVVATSEKDDVDEKSHPAKLVRSLSIGSKKKHATTSEKIDVKAVDVVPSPRTRMGKRHKKNKDKDKDKDKDKEKDKDKDKEKDKEKDKDYKKDIYKTERMKSTSANSRERPKSAGVANRKGILTKKKKQYINHLEILDRCYEFLQRYIGTEGLFRISGETNLVKDLFEYLICSNNPQDVDLIPTNTSPHVVAGVIKQLLRTADPTLIPFERLDEFYSVVETKNLHTTKSTLETMLPYQYQVLQKLIQFLTQIIENSSSNLMDLRNVAIVFSPSFIPNDALEEGTLGTLLYLQAQKKIVVILEFILIHAKNLFNMNDC